MRVAFEMTALILVFLSALNVNGAESIKRAVLDYLFCNLVTFVSIQCSRCLTQLGLRCVPDFIQGSSKLDVRGDECKQVATFHS
ncbi:hypothetical protein F4808DRAFT_147066 [Astrocystis sublimbata]|nr:hypothetical protein F4808DRAFT_147066 [Astrocystis sublimbata]